MTDRSPRNGISVLPTDEALRILQAVDSGIFGVNEHGRYIIQGQRRPDRRTREQLDRNGLIDWAWTRGLGTHWFLTDRGRAMLDA